MEAAEIIRVVARCDAKDVGRDVALDISSGSSIGQREIVSGGGPV